MKTSKTPPNKRNRELAQIHIVKKELGMDDETYRAVLWDVARVQSASNLNGQERRAVLGRFKARGWKNSRQRGKSANDAEWKAPLMSKIGALLADMGLPWSYANGIAKQMYNLARVDWCHENQLRSIITALIKHRDGRCES